MSNATTVISAFLDEKAEIPGDKARISREDVAFSRVALAARPVSVT